ncbi:MAG: hypothetical protein HY791_39415 [Deltaproteobacteria bacterium]|nr:hypothetical protein [Deltaproteobacteria bacterium]
MLGEKLGNERGKITGRRVLTDGKVETSFEASGTILGLEATEFGTYAAEMRPDGSLFGSGQGVLMGKKGERATWAGSGVGKFNTSGGISFRGAVYYMTDSPGLARLNGTCAVFEHEVDAQGNVMNNVFEWK